MVGCGGRGASFSFEESFVLLLPRCAVGRSSRLTHSTRFQVSKSLPVVVFETLFLERRNEKNVQRVAATQSFSFFVLSSMIDVSS